MCGIVGVISNDPKAKGWQDRRTFFTQALYADTLRGFHSTGVMCHDDRDNTVWTHKKAIPAYDMIDMKSYEHIMRDMDHYNFIVGHNRAATRGKVNVDNAHPFNIGNIVGVHNGTIHNQHNLVDGNKFIVDSMAIFNNINEEGSEATIEKINGAFSLVWWDLYHESLHIVRNDERPLSYAVTKDENSIVFASEGAMLPWIAGRNHIQIGKVCQFDVGHEYIFHMGDILNYEKKARKLRPATTTTYYGGGHGGATPVNQGNLGKPRGGSGQKRKGDHLLELHGYKKGDHVEFTILEFYEYSQGKQEIRGKAVGVSMDSDLPNVIVHGLTKEDFHSFKNKELSGAVVTACFDIDYLAIDPNTGARVETLVINGNSVLEKVGKTEETWPDEDVPWSVDEDGVIRGNFTNAPGKKAS